MKTQQGTDQLTNVKVDYKSLALIATDLLFIFDQNPKLACDQLMQILVAATDSEEISSWSMIERAEATDACRQIINLIHAVVPLTQEKYILSQEEKNTLDGAINEIIDVYDNTGTTINLLLKLLGAAMSGETSDIWERNDRSNVTHLCRYVVNMLLSVKVGSQT